MTYTATERHIGTRIIIAEALLKKPLGTVYTLLELMQETGRTDLNFARRHRDLREHGWEINTYREEPGVLGMDEYRLVSYGSVP